MGKVRRIRAGADGLPMREVGIWALEKNERLRKYIEASKGARARWLGPTDAGAAYINLYAGFGLGFIHQDGDNVIEEVPGSPLVALAAAKNTDTQFSEVHLGDSDTDALRTIDARVARDFPLVRRAMHPKEAAASSEAVASQLNPYGLHLAFLDPFSLGALQFTVIAALARLHRVDIIIHVSAQDLNRNLRRAFEYSAADHALDLFAPGWRTAVDPRQKDLGVRMQIIDHWAKLVRGLDLEVFTNKMELVSGSKNQPLYWLAFAARNQLAHKLWDAIRSVQPQRDFFA